MRHIVTLNEVKGLVSLSTSEILRCAQNDRCGQGFVIDGGGLAGGVAPVGFTPEVG